MLSRAANVLQSQAQAARKEHQENTEQSRQNQTIESTVGALDTDTDPSQDVLSSQYTASLDTERHTVPKVMTRSQSKSNCSQTRVEDNDDKSSIAASSMSPSLRYPSDHFLKTREEVYVHSQISMEDSDEGGQSPVAPLTCPTNLGDLQVWRGQTSSELQSPVLTNSSVSHTSSATGSPLSESGVSTDRGLGLPFSGDLMEEENDEEEQEEDRAGAEWTSEAQSEREDSQHFGSSHLVGSEEVNGGSQFPSGVPGDAFLHNAGAYYGDPPRGAVREQWSTEQQIGDLEAPHDRYSPVLR